MKAVAVRLLAAIMTFVVGTTATSFMSTVSKHPVQARTEVIAAASTAENRSAVDHVGPSFHTSSLSRIASMLYQLVESKAKVKTNTFYVEEVNDEALGGKFVRAYWKEDQSVIIFVPPYDSENSCLECTYYKAIDLVRDVVPTEADRGTTNYLVSRDWINDVLTRCVRNGVKFTITRKSTSTQSNRRLQRTRR